MKPVLLGLQKGECITVEVIEVQSDRNLLVNYRTALFRVKNTSGRHFQIGQKIMLVVTQKDPLEFSLAGERRLFSRLV